VFVIPLWGAVTVVLLLWSAGLVVRWIAWMRLGKRSGDAIVSGTVVADAAPVVNEIRQTRTKAKHGWRWSEDSFRSTSQRFTLRRDDGELVAVDPIDPVLLLWKANHTVPIHESARKRLAKLEPGAKVEILGTIDRRAEAPADATPYRDGAAATLVPPRGYPMLISHKPLAPKLRAMSRFQLRRIGLLLGVIGLSHALVDHLWFSEIHALHTHGMFPTTRVVIGVVGAILVIACRDQRAPWDIGQSADEYEALK
jgi:hypothetical protein